MSGGESTLCILFCLFLKNFMALEVSVSQRMCNIVYFSHFICSTLNRFYILSKSQCVERHTKETQVSSSLSLPFSLSEGCLLSTTPKVAHRKTACPCSLTSCQGHLVSALAPTLHKSSESYSASSNVRRNSCQHS